MHRARRWGCVGDGDVMDGDLTRCAWGMLADFEKLMQPTMFFPSQDGMLSLPSSRLSAGFCLTLQKWKEKAHENCAVPCTLHHGLMHPSPRHGPMTTQPHSSGRAPTPLTCPAPSQCAATILDASHTPFMCPSPSHDLTHAPCPPLMHPDVF